MLYMYVNGFEFWRHVEWVTHGLHPNVYPVYLLLHGTISFSAWRMCGMYDGGLSVCQTHRYMVSK